MLVTLVTPTPTTEGFPRTMSVKFSVDVNGCHGTKWHTVAYAIVPLSVCLSLLSVLSFPVCLPVTLRVLWPNSWMVQDKTWHGGRPRSHCVIWGPSSPSHSGTAPKFSPQVVVANGWLDQDATWYGGRPRLKPHCASWEPSSLHKKGHSPQFSAHVYCGKTAGWIKMLYTWYGGRKGKVRFLSHPLGDLKTTYALHL